MEQKLELDVWRLAQQTCDSAAFVRLLEEAVGSFKREPGLDPTVRLFPSGIGVESIRVLRDVLKRHDIYAVPSADYVELPTVRVLVRRITPFISFLQESFRPEPPWLRDQHPSQRNTSF